MSVQVFSGEHGSMKIGDREVASVGKFTMTIKENKMDVKNKKTELLAEIRRLENEILNQRKAFEFSNAQREKLENIHHKDVVEAEQKDALIARMAREIARLHCLDRISDVRR